MSNPTSLNTAVIYGSARRGRQGIKAARFVVRKLEQRGHVVTLVHDSFDDDGNPLDKIYDERVIKFLDEFEWYARALKLARDQKQFDPCLPTQQQLCRGIDESQMNS